MSWLMACMKSKRRVAEDAHLLPAAPGAAIGTGSGGKPKRPRADTGGAAVPETETDSRRPKLRKHDTDTDTDIGTGTDTDRDRGSAPSVPAAPCLEEPPLRPPPPSLRIGSLTVAAYGVGTLAWGVAYPDPAARPSAEEVATLVQAAVSALAPHRVLLDTADSYCTDSHDFGYMETLLGTLCPGTGSPAPGTALQPLGLPVRLPVVATKGGMMRTGSESNSWREAAYRSPEAWEACVRASLARLRCDASHPLPLWQVHHCKPRHLAAAMPALQKLVAEKLILHVGLCNVSVADIEFCQQYLPIASIQNAYSLWDRTAERPLHSQSGRSSASTSKRGVLEYCSENNIPFLAYGVLGGLASRRGEDRWRAYPQLLSLAAEKGIHVTTLVLSMMRHRFPCLLPLVGSRRLLHVEMLRGVAEVRLTQRELDVFPSLN
jgi:aryl-alcohol dehydrogenase-like predicted oxidoreductase